jgi:hypothetical protein
MVDDIIRPEEDRLEAFFLGPDDELVHTGDIPLVLGIGVVQIPLSESIQDLARVDATHAPQYLVVEVSIEVDVLRDIFQTMRTA